MIKFYNFAFWLYFPGNQSYFSDGIDRYLKDNYIYILYRYYGYFTWNADLVNSHMVEFSLELYNGRVA